MGISRKTLTPQSESCAYRFYLSTKHGKGMEAYQIKMKNNPQQYKIEYVNHGIANRYSHNRIEIHKGLLTMEYVPLFTEILLHEMHHSDSSYSMEDFKLDAKGFKHSGLYRKFILTHPSSWIQFSPVYPSNGRWFWDITLLIFYCAMVSTLIIIYGITRLFF